MNALIDDAMRRLAQSADELAELDGLVGDGDLGFTISKGADAVRSALDAMEPGADLQSALIAAARAFGSANPSTFAALTQGALVAAAKVVDGGSLRDATTLRNVLAACAESIQKRGKAEAGDKTVLDPLLATVNAITEEGTVDHHLLSSLASAAQDATDSLSHARSARGRAAWAGERSEGVADPGSVAFVRGLEAFAAALATVSSEVENPKQID